MGLEEEMRTEWKPCCGTDEWMCTGQKGCLERFNFFSLLQSKKKKKKRKKMQTPKPKPKPLQDLQNFHEKNFIVLLSVGLLPDVFQNREDTQWMRQGVRERTIPGKMQFYPMGCHQAPLMCWAIKPVSQGTASVFLIPWCLVWTETKAICCLPSHFSYVLWWKVSSSSTWAFYKDSQIGRADVFS